MNRSTSPRFVPLLLVWGLVAISCVGCMQRRILINSFPEGAAVSVDQQPVGYTPLAIDYQHYGTREILLEKDGFKPVRVKKDFKAPWYQIPPISLITDNFWPRKIRDTRVVEFQMQPQSQVNQQQLIDRAENLRGNVLRGAVSPSLNRQEYRWGN